MSKTAAGASGPDPRKLVLLGLAVGLCAWKVHNGKDLGAMDLLRLTLALLALLRD